MSRAATEALFAMALAPFLLAQNNADRLPVSSPPGTYGQQISPAPSGSNQVLANTEIHAVLDTPLSNRTSKPGDRFIAIITEPVRAANGVVAIAAGSRVEGEIAESEEAENIPALRGKKVLGLRFRDIILASGQVLPFTSALVSVNSTVGTYTKQTAAEEREQDQGGGRITFTGPLKDLATIEWANGGYVLSTKGKDVELPAQTGLVIRLNQPLSTNATANGHELLP